MMKRVLRFLQIGGVLVLGLPFSVGAAPRLALEQDTFDFGAVAQGEIVKQSFVLKNSGDENLDIQRVVPACGCTVSTLEKNKLGPGEETALHVEFDTSGFAGGKVKTVRVYTNDPEQLTRLLTLKGEIVPEVIVDPPRVYFGDVVRSDENGSAQSKSSTKAGKGSNQWPEQLVTFRVREDSKAELGEVITRSRWLKVIPVTNGKREKQLRVLFDPKAKAGEFRDRVVVSVNSSKQRNVNLPVYASVRGSLQIRPQVVAFGIVNGGKPKSKSVRIVAEGRGTTPFRVLSVRSESPAVTAVVEGASSREESSDQTADTNKPEVGIRVTLDPSQVKKDLRSVVRVEVQRENEESEEVLISVTAVLPPKFLENRNG